MLIECPDCRGTKMGDYPYPCDRCFYGNHPGQIEVPDPPEQKPEEVPHNKRTDRVIEV